MNIPSGSWPATILLVASSALPCVLALVFFCRIGGAVRNLLFVLAPLPGLLAALTLESSATLEIDWLFFGGRLGIDPVGRVFLLFTALLWFMAGLYSRFYLKADRRRDQFCAFFLLSQSGNLGLILAQDMLSFYLFFALMSFSAYGLIIHRNDEAARRAGRVYMALVVLGEVLLFVALAMLADSGGTVQPAGAPPLLIALILISFGIKAGALPLHFWLPLAHPVAPIPASAVLSGAMIKAGLLGWLRFLPLGESGMGEWGVLLMIMGLAAAFGAALFGVSQDDPKTVLAYSSISQMGLITIGLGLGLWQPQVWPMALAAVAFYSLHHALTKGALFLGAGVMMRSGRTGLRPILVLCGLVFCSLSLAGLPFTSGAAAKAGLKGLAALLPEPWPDRLPLLLSLGAVGTALLMARFLVLVWARRADGQDDAAGIGMVWAGLVLGLPALPWLWGGDGVEFADLHGLWPVGLGAAIGLLFWYGAGTGRLRWWPRIAAGDMVLGFDWLLGRLLRLFEAAKRIDWPGIAQASGAARVLAAVAAPYGELVGRLGHYERVFKRWTVVGTCYLAILLLLYYLC